MVVRYNTLKKLTFWGGAYPLKQFHHDENEILIFRIFKIFGIWDQISPGVVKFRLEVAR